MYVYLRDGFWARVEMTPESFKSLRDLKNKYAQVTILLEGDRHGIKVSVNINEVSAYSEKKEATASPIEENSDYRQYQRWGENAARFSR